jgi:2-dehydro-3-deoxyphosphogluconate aldolase/(4S)-4-hydroxy-2-oxoglutarate aldolase
MSRFSQQQVYLTIERTGVVPLFYQPNVAMARDIVGACVAGGAHVVEFTNRGDRALGVFSDLVQTAVPEEPDLILGIGSVTDAATASLFIANGADFVVSPYFAPEVAVLCNARKIPYIPGAFTPAEIAGAEMAGAVIVKLFPARVGGPRFLADLLGPSPRSRLLPTGGVAADREGVTSWIRAGAVAVGLGSQLIPAEPTRPGGIDAIAKRVAELREWIAAART